MPNADQLRVMGNEAFSKREFKKAAKIYRDAIKLAASPVLYSNRAQCFINLGDWDRALKDTEEGLRLNAENRVRVKLLFRKAVILKSTNDCVNSKLTLEEALGIDPNNKQVIELMNSLKFNPKKMKLENQKSSRVPIPIESVDEIPEEYKSLMEPNHPSLISKPNPQISEEATSQINQLFPASKKKQPELASRLTKPFTERSGTHHLRALASLPPHKKANGYKYVLELPPDTFNDLFAESGVDAEFLDFFFEATLFASKSNILNDWHSSVLNSLKSMSSCRRFDISLQFVSQENVDAILREIKGLGNEEMYKQYYKILHALS